MFGDVCRRWICVYMWRCCEGGGGVEWWQYAEMVWRCVEMGVVHL